MIRMAFALLAAILMPALFMSLWYLYGQFQVFEPGDPYIWVRARGRLFLCLAVSAAYVIGLGLPVFLVIRKLKAVYWWSTIGSGFLLAAIPPAILSWPLRYAGRGSSASVNGVQTMVDGLPTMAGWLQYVYGLFFMGACGAVAALAFWLVWRSAPKPSLQARGPASGASEA